MCKQYDLPLTAQSKPNTKQQTNQNDNQRTEVKPIQEQSKGSQGWETSRLQDKSSNQQIEQQIDILKSKLIIPKRRNLETGGSMGRATEVEVNHLPLNLDKLFNKVVYHTDVKFKPKLPRKLLRIALEEFNNKHYPNIHFAFDGKRNMFTVSEIKGKTDIITVLNDENNRPVEFAIVTSAVKIIPMNKIAEYLKSGSSVDLLGDAFHALDIILKNRPFSLRFTNYGRAFFPLPCITPVDLGDGMELWKGFFQNPVMGWKPYLNVDVAYKGFPKQQPLISYITNDLQVNPNSEMDRKNINRLLNSVKGLKIEFMIPMQPNTKRVLKVVGILDSASKFIIKMNNPIKGNLTLNVVQYYKMVHNYNIKYPNLPCLHVGHIDKKMAIPIELCIIKKGQLRLKNLSDMQTGIMLKNVVCPPRERQLAIENSIKNINYSQDPVLKEFGVDITEQFASIPARVLDQPSLTYAQNKEIKPKAGIWRVDKFVKAVLIQNWVVLNLDRQINIASIKNFEKMLILSGKDLNVTIEPMNHVISLFIPRKFNLDEYKAKVESIFTKLKACNTEIIFVIFPEFPTGVYGIIKQKSELEVGVLTQCIKSKTMSQMNKPTTFSILRKINTKLNGTNHTLHDKSSPPCMAGAIIFGADVTHPNSETSINPSVAAVVASHDINGSQYNMEWRLQAPGEEIIQDLEDIIHTQLLKFKDKTNTMPKKIFYFRDGVNEGQFQQLLEFELVAIRRACLRLHINYQPPMTLLIVQKQHHTRMFPKFNNDMDGKFSNITPGMIVDTQITHPTELDFYLCSHPSIQGTSKPTKYHLIWDENNLTEDQLEQLTFYLCFIFARCTNSVSYPAPTYYAHLAAFRAQTYLENKTINLNRLDDEQFKNKLNHSFTVKTPMFFI
ncbi:protein argonaute-2-like [Aphis craccivora]|uniref:Protein argonaute-2-like n=1 Tax=Aphis craccivora TaxID=307492 RepID=A0A6G0Z6K1_APHCR|nr:protein argonaute-2-like [Aphis craccivora]